MSRVFTDEELKNMGMRTVDLLIEAIEGDDKKQAIELAKRMFREFAFMHDLYRDWSAIFMDYIYTNYGEDDLYQVLRQVIAAPGRPSYQALVDADKVDFRFRVHGLAHLLRGHLQPMKVEEDDEKVCIQMQPCGSGQRLIEDGGYKPPLNLTTIRKPHQMTWGLTDFPIYCTHCPVLMLISIEQLGYPAIVAIPGEKVASGSCKYCIFKNPEDIPEDIYTMLKRQKPK